MSLHNVCLFVFAVLALCVAALIRTHDHARVDRVETVQLALGPPRQTAGWFAPLALCAALSGCAAGQQQSAMESAQTVYSWARRICGVVVGLPAPSGSSSGSP